MKLTLHWPGALLLASALVLVPCLVLLAITDFDGLYGQDAYGYLNYAGGPLLEALRELRLPPPFFFPIGYPLSIAAGALLGLDPATAALGLSLAAGAAVPVLVGLLAVAVVPVSMERHRLLVGLLAGIVAATAGHLWQSSVVAMSDTLALASATAGLLAALRYARAPRFLWAALALALLTFAVETRLVYGAVALAAVVPLINGLRLRRPSRRVLDLAGGCLVALVVAAPMALPILDSLARGASTPFLGQAVVHGWNPFNAFRSEFDTADGRLVYQVPSGLFYVLQPFAPYWFGLLAVLVVPGLIAVLRRRTAERLAVLLFWPLIVIGFMAGDAYQNTRFSLAVLPPIAILIAIGVWLVWHVARRRWRRHGGRAVLLVVAIALLVNGLLAWRFTYSFIERVSGDTADIERLVLQLPPGARIISLGPTGQLLHDGLDSIELTSLDPHQPGAALDPAQPAYLIVDLESIRRQWAGRQPEQVVDSLERNFGLEEVAASGQWTVFRIGLPISSPGS